MSFKQQLFFVCVFFLIPFYGIAGFEHGESENNDNTDNTIIIARIKGDDVVVTVPKMIFTFTETPIKIQFRNPEHTRLLYNNNKVNFIINGEDTELTFVNGETTILRTFTTNDTAIKIYAEEFSYTHSITPIALWYIILPGLIVIALLVFVFMRKQNKNAGSAN